MKSHQPHFVFFSCKFMEDKEYKVCELQRRETVDEGGTEAQGDWRSICRGIVSLGAVSPASGRDFLLMARSLGSQAVPAIACTYKGAWEKDKEDRTGGVMSELLFGGSCLYVPFCFLGGVAE